MVNKYVIAVNKNDFQAMLIPGNSHFLLVFSPRKSQSFIFSLLYFFFNNMADYSRFPLQFPSLVIMIRESF